MDWNIRSIKSNEIKIIQKLAYEIWPAAYAAILTKEQIDYMLRLFYDDAILLNDFNKPGYRYYVISVDDVAVGFVAVEPTSETNWHIHKIYIHQNSQGKGLGRSLIEFVENTAKYAGVLSVSLNVNRYNPALHFYKACGFHVEKEVDISIGNGYWMNDFVMQKSLKPL